MSPRKKFSDSEFRELYDKGLNDREIAERLNVTIQSVWWRRKKLGLEPNYECVSWSREKVLERLKEIAEDLGHSPSRKEARRYYGSISTEADRYFGSWNNAKEEAGLEVYNRGGQGSQMGKRQRIKEVLQRNDPVLLSDLSDEVGLPRKTINSLLGGMDSIKKIYVAVNLDQFSAGDFYHGEYIQRTIVFRDEERFTNFFLRKVLRKDLSRRDGERRRGLKKHLKRKLPKSVFDKIS